MSPLNSFLDYCFYDLIQNIEKLNHLARNILVITYTNNQDLINSLETRFPNSNIEYFDLLQENINYFLEENIIIDNSQLKKLNNKKFELIIFASGFVFIRNIKNMLKLIEYFLTEKGILISNFLCSQSFLSLRYLFIEIETIFTKAHFNHFLPLINFDHISPLLKSAGFNEHIITKEIIELEYKNPIYMIEDLHKIKNTNKSLYLKNTYAISKDMITELRKRENKFLDKLILATLLASKKRGIIKTS